MVGRARGRRGAWPGGLPRTCRSRPRMTCTACCRMSSLVCALSDLRCSWHMRPSSRKASLMSRTRTRSRALLAMRLSRSLRSFSSRDSTSSVLLGHSTGASISHSGAAPAGCARPAPILGRLVPTCPRRPTGMEVGLKGPVWEAAQAGTSPTHFTCPELTRRAGSPGPPGTTTFPAQSTVGAPCVAVQPTRLRGCAAQGKPGPRAQDQRGPLWDPGRGGQPPHTEPQEARSLPRPTAQTWLRPCQLRPHGPCPCRLTLQGTALVG